MKLTILSTFLVIGAIAFIALLVSFGNSRSVVTWDRGTVFSDPRIVSEADVRIVDLPDIVEALSRSAEYGNYAAIVFNTTDQPDDYDAIDLNMTIEDHQVGFDWVLLRPENIRDQKRFIAFANNKGFEPVRRTTNGVNYLRVEGVDVAEFAASVITDMYERPEDQPLGLYREGFEWPDGDE
ncbi:hypothetical protein OAS19_03440 [Altererythrobacter sp.]|nr:hypothetical protein [Altererythrobacter sp.]